MTDQNESQETVLDAANLPSVATPDTPPDEDSINVTLDQIADDAPILSDEPCPTTDTDLTADPMAK